MSLFSHIIFASLEKNADDSLELSTVHSNIIKAKAQDHRLHPD